MVPSAPSAMPRGSPGSLQRLTTFESRVETELRTSAANAAEQVSSTRATVARLLLEGVGEVFDDRVREESFTHLLQLPFELLP